MKYEIKPCIYDEADGYKLRAPFVIKDKRQGH